MTSNISLNKSILFLFFFFTVFIGNSATYYVNDNSNVGDLWCTSVGSVGGVGSKNSPFLTLKYVIQNVAKSGDVIYVDAGTYNDKQISESILKESNITIIGAGSSKTKFINTGGSFGVYFMRIYNIDNISIKNILIQGFINTVSYEGEAITINNSHNISFENVVFAKSNGGSGEAAVVISDESSVSFDKISFVCQTQATNGGGIDIKKGGGGTPHNVTVTIDNSMISYNNRSGGFSGTNGGGMIIEGDATVNVTINNSSISDNSARAGGGIYMSGGILNMNNCCIANNTSITTDPDYGGGIWFAGTSGLCTLTNCSFSNNTINSARGGGIGLSAQAKSVNVSLVSCDFSSNKATLGNDICTKNVSSRTVTLSANNCTFGSGGTVINNISGLITLTDCGTPSVSGTVSSNNGTRSGLTSTNCPVYGGACPTIYICNPAKTGPNVTVTCPATTAKLTATGPAGSVFYWYDVAIGGTVLDTSSSATPDFDITGVNTSKTYYVVSSLDGCETRVPVTVTYNCPSCTTIITYPSNPYCQTGIASPTVNDASTGTYSCTVSSTGNTNDLVFVSAGTGVVDLLASKPGTYTIQFAVTGQPTCKPTATITILNTVSPSASSNQEFCKSSNKTVGDLVATGTGIKWYLNPTGGNALLSSDVLQNSTKYYATQTSSSCESVNRTEVIVTLKDDSTPTGSASQSFCKLPQKTIADLVATGNDIKWYADPTGGAALNSTDILTTKTYYATQTSGSCESPTRFTVDVTINDNSSPSGTASQKFCKSASKTIADLVATGSTIKWYADPTGGTALNSTDILTTKTYYATQTTGSCESETRLVVNVTVIDNTISALEKTKSACLGADGVATVSGSGTGNLTWSGTANGSANGITLNHDITGLGAGTYSITFNDGTCSATTSVTISNLGAPNPPSKIEASGPTSFCEGESITLKASIIPVGATINWKKDGVAFGNPNDNPITVSAGGTYAVTVTVSGCTSDANDTTITVNPLPDEPVIDNADLIQKFCKSENAKVSNLKPSTGVIWFDVNGTKLSPTDLLTSTDYYAALESDKGCFTEKTDRIKVTVIIKDNPSEPAVTTPQNFCKVDDKKVADLDPKSSGTIEIKWYFGSTAQLTTDKLQKGTYTVESVEAGCTSLNKKTVVVDVIDVPVPNLPTDKLCANNQASLTLTDVYKGVSNYYFYDILTSNILSGTKTIANGEQYIVKQSLNGCLSDGLTITIAISNGPTLLSNPYILTPSLCEVDKPTFDDVEAKYSTLPASSGTLFWYESAASSLSNFITKNKQVASGSYWLAVKDASGCYSNKQEVKLTVDPGTKPTLKPIELCSTSEYKVLDLNVSNISNPTGIITWYYANGGSNVADNTISVSKDPVVQYWASYKKTVGECEGEMVKLDLTWIQFNQSLTLTETNQKFCKTASKTIADLNLLPYTSAQVAWFEDAISLDVLPNITPVYEKTYYAAEYKITTDGKYCINSNRSPVDVDFYSTKIYPTVKEGVCTKQNGSIEFVNPPLDYTFNWYEMTDETKLDFIGAKYTKPLEKQSFKIVMYDAKGCKDSITVSMPQCTDSPIPQVITPNGDNNNDKWVINYASKYKNVQVKIYNRWGNEVYSSAIPYTDDWEGKYKNEYLPTGTYYYVIDKGNDEPVETGFIEFVK